MDEQDIQDCLGESRVLQFRASKRIFNIDAQDIQDLVLGVCSALILGISNPASEFLVGQHPVQQPFILFILLILCIDVKKSAADRWPPSGTHRFSKETLKTYQIRNVLLAMRHH